MEADFIQHRREMLENFVIQLAKYKFIVDSFEFQIFSRKSHQELDRQLNALLKESPGDILIKYQGILKIDFNGHTKKHKKECWEICGRFNAFIVQALAKMKDQKNTYKAL